MKGTAGVITNAAAIMVAVALIFAFTRHIGLQQFGFGLAVAILVDATIIRTFLLPTTMKLLGRWNWYLPSWLSAPIGPPESPRYSDPRVDFAAPPCRPKTQPSDAGSGIVSLDRCDHEALPT